MFTFFVLEIDYIIILRTDEINSKGKFKYKLPANMLQNHRSPQFEIYLEIKGENDRHTRKICLNNYEVKKKSGNPLATLASSVSPEQAEANKLKTFNCKLEDVGKIQKINVSINEDDTPSNWILIDFIEIKIVNRSEAYV
jgi:hypothetical protein